MSNQALSIGFGAAALIFLALYMFRRLSRARRTVIFD